MEEKEGASNYPRWMDNLANTPFEEIFKKFLNKYDDWVQKVMGEKELKLNSEIAQNIKENPETEKYYQQSEKFWKEVEDGIVDKKQAPEKRDAQALLWADDLLRLERRGARRVELAVLVLPHLHDDEFMEKLTQLLAQKWAQKPVAS